LALLNRYRNCSWKMHLDVEVHSTEHGVRPKPDEQAQASNQKMEEVSFLEKIGSSIKGMCAGLHPFPHTRCTLCKVASCRLHLGDSTDPRCRNSNNGGLLKTGMVLLCLCLGLSAWNEYRAVTRVGRGKTHMREC